MSALEAIGDPAEENGDSALGQGVPVTAICEDAFQFFLAIQTGHTTDLMVGVGSLGVPH